jgi:hypothetical protein
MVVQAGCGGGPELTLADVCPTCVRGQLQQLISRSMAQDTRGTLLQELEVRATGVWEEVVVVVVVVFA